MNVQSRLTAICGSLPFQKISTRKFVRQPGPYLEQVRSGEPVIVYDGWFCRDPVAVIPLQWLAILRETNVLTSLMSNSLPTDTQMSRLRP
jgi:hypothetical protein